MKPAAAAGIVTLLWLMFRKSTACCPHCDWEVGGDERMPSADDLLGIAPDWTGGLTVDEYMREQRER